MLKKRRNLEFQITKPLKDYFLLFWHASVNIYVRQIIVFCFFFFLFIEFHNNLQGHETQQNWCNYRECFSSYICLWPYCCLALQMKGNLICKTYYTFIMRSLANKSRNEMGEFAAHHCCLEPHCRIFSSTMIKCCNRKNDWLLLGILGWFFSLKKK